MAFGLASPAVASSVVEGAVVAFRSPGGVEERCVVLARMPSAAHRDSDVLEERALCAADVPISYKMSVTTRESVSAWVPVASLVGREFRLRAGEASIGKVQRS